MICPTCRHEATRLRSVIVSGSILSGCERCIASQSVSGTELAAKSSREWQKREYEKDLVQPNDPRFAKAYGADRAKEYGWTDDELRKHT